MVYKTTNKTTNNESSITFTGVIRSIRFYSEQSSWGVISVATKEDVPYSRIIASYIMDTNKLEPEYEVNVVGKMPEPQVGDIYQFEGKHVYNPKYKSDQYEIVSVNSIKPKTVEQQKTYLQALLTNKQTETLLSIYPNIVDDVINGNDNINLSLLDGIKEITWGKIKDKIISNFAISDILSLLIPLGISFNKIKRLLSGENNPQILKQKILNDPYIITNIEGISFKTADKIAIQLNSNLLESEKRLIAFIKYFLHNTAIGDGHTYVSIDYIRNKVLDNVPEVEKFLNVLIEFEIKNKTFLHIEDEKIGLKRYYNSENFIFNTLVELNNTTPLLITYEQLLEGIKISEEQLGFIFTEEQKLTVLEIGNNNFNLLTGKAGTGKSTLSRAILNSYSLAGYSIAVTALSAKAALRAEETTGFRATTIHRMLQSQGDGTFEFNETNHLPYDIILVDECSMMNSYLFESILEAVDLYKCKVIFVGDRGQLPPIGAGNIFSDLFDVDYNFNKYELTKIQRQAQSSAIIVDGNKIREGIDPVENKEPKIIHGELQDLYYIFRESKEVLFNIAVSTFVKSVSEKGIENVVLLVPRKKDTLNSTKELNKAIQKEINSANQDIKFVHGEREYWFNDKVIHVNNDYQKNIFNGEIGLVSKIEATGIDVQYQDKVIQYTHEDIDDLELAYALTVHKMQGSQSKDVIVVLDNTHFMLLSNQLLYTAITRTQERCLLLCQPFAFDKSLEENKNVRNTWLKDFQEIENSLKLPIDIAEKSGIINEEENNLIDETMFLKF